MKKSLFFWMYFIATIVLAVYFASRIINNKMGRGPIINVKNILMTNTAKEKTKNQDFESIRIATGVSNGTRVKSLDLKQINDNVLNVPGIKNAATRLLPNGNLIIKTQQHDVVAMLTDGAFYYPLSADGTKIEAPSSTRNINTIVFQGELPRNWSDISGELITALSDISEYIDYVNMVESRRWDLHTTNGTTIYLPEEKPTKAINALKTLNKNHKILSRKIEIIDMRDDKRILVKPEK